MEVIVQARRFVFRLVCAAATLFGLLQRRFVFIQAWEDHLDACLKKTSITCFLPGKVCLKRNKMKWRATHGTTVIYLAIIRQKYRIFGYVWFKVKEISTLNCVVQV